MKTNDELPVIWHPDYSPDIGDHVFLTAKYRLIHERLLHEGTITQSLCPESVADEQMRLVHTDEYIDMLGHDELPLADELALEVPYSPEIRDAMWLCVGGTVLTAREALKHGVASHLCGGFHHAHPGHGEGFCLVNDVAVAARTMIEEGRVKRVLIVDCDVHHGNGTAVIFAKDPAVFTFSMHQEANYPQFKPASDIDLGLADGTDDVEYLSLIDKWLPQIVETFQPQLAFYLAGADPYAGDSLGGLDLSIDGLKERDRTVISILRNAEVAVATVMAGGYTECVEDAIEIGCNTVRVANDRITQEWED